MTAAKQFESVPSVILMRKSLMRRHGYIKGLKRGESALSINCECMCGLCNFIFGVVESQVSSPTQNRRTVIRIVIRYAALLLRCVMLCKSWGMSVSCCAEHVAVRFALMCCYVLCCAMPCCAVLSYAVLCSAITWVGLCCEILFCAVLGFVMCCAMLRCTT